MAVIVYPNIALQKKRRVRKQATMANKARIVLAEILERLDAYDRIDLAGMLLSSLKPEGHEGMIQAHEDALNSVAAFGQLLVELENEN